MGSKIRIAAKVARALSMRLERLSELSDLRAQGIPFPARTTKWVWKAPHDAVDYIDLSVFVDPRKSVTLLDVGANVGLFASQFLEFFPHTCIHAFEPVPSTFVKLAHTLGDRATLHPLALSDQKSRRDIWTDDNNTLSSLERYRDVVNEFYGMEYNEKVEIACERLDDLDLPPFEGQVVLKVDVQGHEIPMFLGAEKTLKQVDVVLAELTFAPEYENQDPSFPKVCGILEKANLYPVIFQEFGRSRSNYGYERDVVFVKRHLLDKIWR